MKKVLKEVSNFKLSDVVFIMLINVKLPTIVGILTFMSRINIVLSPVEHEKSFITSRPVFNNQYFNIKSKIFSMEYKKENDYHQEIPQSHTADQPMAP